jgi:hypothetical protein
MAEQSTTSSTSATTPTPKTKQFIKPSSYDDELEPDALRGSEQVMKDSGVEDKEQVRRDVYKKERE